VCLLYAVPCATPPQSLMKDLLIYCVPRVKRVSAVSCFILETPQYILESHEYNQYCIKFVKHKFFFRIRIINPHLSLVTTQDVATKAVLFLKYSISAGRVD
jgi:hypothetical protein